MNTLSLQILEQHSSSKILVVAEDDNGRAAYRAMLSPAGFSLSYAHDYHSACYLFENKRPDIVLIETTSDLAVCNKIRELSDTQGTPILMVADDVDSQSLYDAYAAGATDVIAKPANPELLRHRLYLLEQSNNTIKALLKNEQMLELAQRTAQLGSWEWQPATDQFRYSDACLSLYNLSKTKDSIKFRDFIRASVPEDRRIVCNAFRCLGSQERNITIEHRIQQPSGGIRYVNLQIELVENGDQAHYIGTVQDITQSKLSEDRIRQLAYYDSLTGLPNRRLFRAQLERALDSAAREESCMALFYVNLDRFKQINDSLGHDAGDDLLSRFAERLRLSTRKSDFPARNSDDEYEVEMSRLGGDEFTVMLTHIRSAHDAGHVAQRLIDRMQEPFVLKDAEIYATASVGISLFPHDGKDMDTLLKCADIAMHHAKTQGRNSYHLYNKTMNDSVENRLNMEYRIRKAIQNTEFEVYYQPRIDAETRKISGLEALLRWPQADGSVIMPNDFIPIAEENKLIVPLGSWVIQDVVQQIKSWRAIGIDNIPVAVNVSGHQLLQGDLAEYVSTTIDQSGIPAKLLELEITESVLIDQAEHITASLDTLNTLGIKVAIDDFGTGYSSMTTLQNFSLDILKIDRSFVTELPMNSKNIAITEAIITMARGLEMEIIAEGIETEEQMDFFRMHSCDQVQGFLFSPAVNADQITESLLAQQGA